MIIGQTLELSSIKLELSSVELEPMTRRQVLANCCCTTTDINGRLRAVVLTFSMDRTDGNEWIRPTTVCAATIAVVYGIVGFVLGMHGVAMPCNRYADVNVTGCGPGHAFGDFLFNIVYNV